MFSLLYTSGIDSLLLSECFLDARVECYQLVFEQEDLRISRERSASYKHLSDGIGKKKSYWGFLRVVSEIENVFMLQAHRDS